MGTGSAKVLAIDTFFFITLCDFALNFKSAGALEILKIFLLEISLELVNTNISIRCSVVAHALMYLCEDRFDPHLVNLVN